MLISDDQSLPFQPTQTAVQGKTWQRCHTSQDSKTIEHVSNDLEASTSRQRLDTQDQRRIMPASSSTAPAAPPTFTPSTALIAYDEDQLRRVATVAIHAVLFQRILGSISPGTATVAGVELPIVAEPKVIALVKAKVSQLLETIRLQAGNAQSKLGSQVKISFHQSVVISSAKKGVAVDEGNRAGRQQPSSYPYAWLAQAFAGGIGGGAHTGDFISSDTDDNSREGADDTDSHHIALQSDDAASSGPWVPDLGIPPVVRVSRGDTRREEMRSATSTPPLTQLSWPSPIFESFVLPFQLAGSSGYKTYGQQGSDEQREVDGDDSRQRRSLLAFLDELLSWTDEHTEQIPLITNTEISPFPVSIEIIGL